MADLKKITQKRKQEIPPSKEGFESEGSASHFFKSEPLSQKDKARSNSPAFMGVAADTDLPWLKNLWEFGRQRALSKGKTRASQEDIKALTAHAEAMAESHAPLPWDPANNPHDTRLIKELDQLDAELVSLKAKLSEQINDLEEVERECANLSK